MILVKCTIKKNKKLKSIKLFFTLFLQEIEFQAIHMAYQT